MTVRAILAGEPSVDIDVAAGRSGLDRRVHGARIQKSGLALAGHFHGIKAHRIQVLGVTEMTYLQRLDEARCRDAVRRFLELDLCCVVVTEGDETMVPGSVAREALIEYADEIETPLLVTPERSSRTIVALHTVLDEELAPRRRVHGVLVDVFEVGLLLLGHSGVGKSEIALELIMRGHRLVADDVVECQYRPPGMVFGGPADLLRHHLEVRGLGILNIKDLFGVTAIRDRKRIDVVVRLVDTPDETEDDRLGLDESRHSLLGVDIPELHIVVRPGRDMASIMEIAARNELLKSAGHHPGRELLGRIEGAVASESQFPPRVATGEPSPPETWPSADKPRPPESSVGLPRKPKP